MPSYELHQISCTMCMQGRTVDFKNTLIIMTSNVGSSVIEKGGGGLGFQLDTNEEDSSYNRIKTLVNEELKQYFRPEFLNRCTPNCHITDHLWIISVITSSWTPTRRTPAKTEARPL